MIWVERMLEERLERAARDGELDGGPLNGRPLPDLDRQRPQGWWADRFARRELSHDRRHRAEDDASRARAGFWHATTEQQLHDRVAAANRALTTANVNLVDADRLEPFDLDTVAARWRELRGV